MTINTFKTGICNVFTVYLLTIYILFCPGGYMDYDQNKQSLLFFGVILFLVALFFTKVAELFFKINAKGKDDCTMEIASIEESALSYVDYAVPVTIFCMFCGVLTASDKHDFFFGDEYRCTGFIFISIALGGCMAISRMGKWNDWMTICLIISFFLAFEIQILQTYGIDPFNWLNNGEYEILLGTLGNLDQNGYFDGVAVATLMGFFLYEKKKSIAAFLRCMLVVGFLAGMETRSDSFYASLGIAVLFLFGYSIKKNNIRNRCLQIWICFYFAAVIQHMIPFRPLFEYSATTKIVVSSPFLMIIAFLIVALFFLYKCKFFQSNKACNLMLGIYIVFIFGVVFIIMYMVKQSHPWLTLPMADLNLRIREWKIAIELVQSGNWLNYLFGIGFGHFSKYSSAYIYFGEGMVLADAHNIFVDIYVSVGAIGLVSYIAFFASTVLQLLTKQKNEMKRNMGLLLIAAYIGGGLLNFNMIVVMPVSFALLGYTLKYEDDYS